MRIDIISKSNCKFNPFLLWDKGLGGSEYAIIFLAEELGRMGHEVHIWNDTEQTIKYGEVVYHSISGFDFQNKTDLCIIFRVSIHARPNAKKVIFFSCDQYTDFSWDRMFGWLDKFVCISQFHARYILANYKIKSSLVTVCELGVNIPDYLNELEKKPGQMIFCSVPDRGLQNVFLIWPEVLKRVPNASLIITSDYTLWGRSTDPSNHQYKNLAQRLDNITFLGAVKREELVRLQKQSEIMIYPCCYDENFCISAMECIAAGAVPVVMAKGAVSTTVANSGIVVEGDFNKPDVRIDYLNKLEELATNSKKRNELMAKGIKRARTNYSYSAVANRFFKCIGLDRKSTEYREIKKGD